MNNIVVVISVLLLFSCNQVADKPDGSTNLVSSPDTKIEKAVISFRILITQSLPEKRFNELIELFDKKREN